MARVLGESLSSLTSEQDIIASFATEQEFGFLIQVLWSGALGWSGLLAPPSLADLLGGSNLGACVGGVGAGGSTLGAATLGSTLGGIFVSGGLCG